MSDSTTWPTVYRMAEQMEQKLSENRHKGDRRGWILDSPEALIRRCREELDELEAAVLAEQTGESVWREAADVANFAMMIADSYEHDIIAEL
jgi:NTP pyrophosphatase (non-canonical NTP hydrolase)